MKPEAQRIAIAEACGWHDFTTTSVYGEVNFPDGDGCDGFEEIQAGINPAGKLRAVPLYLTDLNACHDMEKVLTQEQFFAYCENLGRVLDLRTDCHGTRDAWRIHTAAKYRAEAFLKTLNLWKEEV